MKITLILAPFALLAFAGCASKPAATAPNAVDAPLATDNAANRVGDPIAMTTPPPSVQKPVPTATLMNARDMKLDTKNYRVRGQVTGVEKSPADNSMTLIVKHEDIPKFMPSMEMRVPFANKDDAKKVKAGDKIAFDMNRANLETSNFQVLPPSTQLKLKK